MTRVALFGSGWIQDFHARGVQAHGDVLVAVANHREETGRAFAERYGIPRVTTDWEALAADPEVEAAIVVDAERAACPAGDRAAAEREARAGREADGDPRGRVRRHDRPRRATGLRSLMVAHCWRFRDEVRAMRERIVAGELGEIVQDAWLRGARRVGTERLVHRPGAGRWRGARRHGRARDRHRAVPARRSGAGPRRARRSARDTRRAGTRSTTTAGP